MELYQVLLTIIVYLVATYVTTVLWFKADRGRSGYEDCLFIGIMWPVSLPLVIIWLGARFILEKFDKRMKKCKNCLFAQQTAISYRSGRRRWYCQWILQSERSKKDGDESKAFISPEKEACDKYPGCAWKD